MTTLATPANMRAYEEQNTPRKVGEITVLPVRAVALDLATGETFSASAGDYFTLADSEPLRSTDNDEPLVLVIERHITIYTDALTGRDLD